jgi:release factor glutamine methyltransferase
MQINQARLQLRQDLIPLYGESEAGLIVAMVIEKLTGFSRADLLMHGNQDLGDEQQQRFTRWCEDLIAWKPVQYVLGECWFADMPFFVDESVLIPRPETEELVEWIRSDFRLGNAARVDAIKSGNNAIVAGSALLMSDSSDHSRILDIGTGSGCIAIALQKFIPDAEVWAVDISTQALAVAEKNAENLSSDIHFRALNILDARTWKEIPSVDLMVSNPPYIPRNDAHAMRPNVLRYEPHLALFVEDDDPLIFYRCIGTLGLAKLLQGGAIYFELHEDLAGAVSEMMRGLGYTNLDMQKDLQGKWRMLRARL